MGLRVSVTPPLTAVCGQGRSDDPAHGSGEEEEAKIHQERVRRGGERTSDRRMNVYRVIFTKTGGS